MGGNVQVNAFRIAEYSACLLASMFCIASAAASEEAISSVAFWPVMLLVFALAFVIFLKYRSHCITITPVEESIHRGSVSGSVYDRNSMEDSTSEVTFYKKRDAVPSLTWIAQCDYSDEHAAQLDFMFRWVFKLCRGLECVLVAAIMWTLKRKCFDRHGGCAIFLRDRW